MYAEDLQWADIVPYGPGYLKDLLCYNELTNLKVLEEYLPVPVADWSKARVCGRSLAGITGWNSAGGMNVSLVGVVR